MPVTGLYFIPSSASTSSYSLLDPFIERFQAAYQNATFTGRWALEHRLLRDTPSIFQAKTTTTTTTTTTADPNANPIEPRYMHFLNLSTFPNQAFIYASPLPKRELEEAAAAAVAATRLQAKPPEPPEPVAPLPPISLAEKNKTATEPVQQPSSQSAAGGGTGAGAETSSSSAAEAHPDDEAQLLQQQEMLFKQHLEKHREQQQQMERMKQEEEARKAKEEEERAKEEERMKLEEQQRLLFEAAAAASHKQAGEQKEQQQEQANEQRAKEKEEKKEAEEEYDEKRMVMIAVDTASFYTWYNITLRAAQPLWVPRHTVTVPSLTSSVFEIADFRVRIGEVKQVAPVTRTRGLIVEIEYNGPGVGQGGGGGESESRSQSQQDSQSSSQQQQQQHADRRPLTESDWEVGEILIREFWNRFAIPGAKEYIRVKDIGLETRSALRKGVDRLTTSTGGGAGGGGGATKFASPATSDGITGVDLARQYMEAFRFSR